MKKRDVLRMMNNLDDNTEISVMGLSSPFFFVFGGKLYIEESENSFASSMDNIKIDSRTGLWYLISIEEYKGKNYYIMEHQELGDLADMVLIDEQGKEVEDYEIKGEIFMVNGQDRILVVRPKKYHWNGMKKISEKEAMDLFGHKAVYLLYDDNTESLAECYSDILNHLEEYGVEL